MGNWCFPGSLNKTQECTHTGLNPEQRPTLNPVIPGKGWSTGPVPKHPWCSSKSIFPAMEYGLYQPLTSETWLYHWRIRGTYMRLLANGPITRTIPRKDLAWAHDRSSRPSPPPTTTSSLQAGLLSQGSILRRDWPPSDQVFHCCLSQDLTSSSSLSLTNGHLDDLGRSHLKINYPDNCTTLKFTLKNVNSIISLTYTHFASSRKLPWPWPNNQAPLDI